MVCYAVSSMNTMPARSTDINNVPRLASAWKLQKQEVTANGVVTSSEPWRTQENHMAEWIEIIHRFVPPGGTIWDPTCGAMTSGMAALRLSRACIMTDRDAPLVEAAEMRLKYYWQWAQKTFFVSLGHPPEADDGKGLYRFHNPMLHDNKLDEGRVASLPFQRASKGDYPEVGTEAHDTLCASLGVKIMDSTIEGAGKGLFLVAPKVVGNPWEYQRQDVLRLPYWGQYIHTAGRSNRDILVHPDARTVGAHPVYVRGSKDCPATYINDPLVLCTPCCFSFCTLFRCFFCDYYTSSSKQTKTKHYTVVSRRWEEATENCRHASNQLHVRDK